MAEQKQQQTKAEQASESAEQGARSGMSTAAKAAAAAAATGAATVAVRKVLGRDHSDESGNGASATKEKSTSRSGGNSLFGSVASGGWEAARDALVPIAEDAAEAAGKYLATNGPEFVRDRLVPRFIDSFNNAKDSG